MLESYTVQKLTSTLPERVAMLFAKIQREECGNVFLKQWGSSWYLYAIRQPTVACVTEDGYVFMMDTDDYFNIPITYTNTTTLKRVLG